MQHVRNLLVLVGFSLTAIGFSYAEDDKIPLDKLPKAVVDAVKAKFPKAEMVSAEKDDEDGKIAYEVTIKDKGVKLDVKVSAEGKILEIEKEIALKDLPKVYTDAIEAKFPKSTIKEAEEVTKDGKTYIEAIVITADKKKFEVVFDKDGKIASATEEKEEKKEEKKKDKK